MSSKTSHPPHQSLERVQSIDYLSALFLVLAIWFIPTGSESDVLNSLSIVFVSIVLEAIPFMFVGSLIGGLIKAFVSREQLASFPNTAPINGSEVLVTYFVQNSKKTLGNNDPILIFWTLDKYIPTNHNLLEKMFFCLFKIL